MKQEQETKRLLPLLMILLVCFMTATGIYIYLLMRREPVWSGQLEYEANVVMGDISGKSMKGWQRELNSVMREGILSTSIDVTPSSYAGGRDRAVDQLIEDSLNQGKLIRVEITRDSMGELIYRTRTIRPGSYVESAKPLLEMPAGVYDCTAVFYAYKVGAEELVDQVAVNAHLILLERGEEGSY